MTELNQDPNVNPVEDQNEYTLDSNGYITKAVWLVVDTDGDAEVSIDEGDAEDRFEENIGGTAPRRKVRINVRLRVPQVTTTSAHVPDESGQMVEAKPE